MRRLAVLHALVALPCVAGCASDGGADEHELEDEAALTWLDEGCSGAPSDSQRCDQGLFWFGKGNTSAQWRPGRSNPNFDPKKPTVIYVHGWQPDAWKTKARESFNYKKNDPETGVDVNIADTWIDKGWNVGLFYWNRLSDDTGDGYVSAPDTAEAKIWRTDGPGGMRWRKDDGSFETKDVPKKPASELFFDVFSSAMRDYRGPHVRIAGHSLGNQMATRLAFLVSKAVDAGKLPAQVMPKRLALLDPYWSKQKVGDTRVGPARDVRDNVYMLARRGVAIEQYKTSSINDCGLGDDNPFVEENAAYTELYPDYFGFWNSVVPWTNLRSDHRAAPNLYFWSYSFQPFAECGGTRSGLSASATDEAVRAMMNPSTYWVQKYGQDTPTPADDCVVMKTDARPAQSPVGLAWTRRSDGKVDVQVLGPPTAVRTRYFIDGHKMATINGAPGDTLFATTLEPKLVQRETLIVASMFNAKDELLGTSENMIDLEPGVGMYIRQQGGMNFEVGFDGAGSEIVAVELDVDGTAITDESTKLRRSTRQAVRASYPRRDALSRTFVLRGYDAAGNLVNTLERKFILR